MKQSQRFALKTFCLLALLALQACDYRGYLPTKTSERPLSVTEIQESYVNYEDQLVSVSGYGIVMMTLPLCPGYVGMEKRVEFIDAERDMITAVSRTEGSEESSSLHVFQAYVRVFRGEIGYPGSVHSETFPYLEIVAIK